MTSLNKQIADLYGILAFMQMSDEEQARHLAAARAAARAKRERANARFAAALDAATDLQSARIAKLELDGYKAVKLWTNRSTQQIAVMLQRDGVWNEKNGRISTSLYMVYPDGRSQQGFGKVAVQNDWF